MSSKRFKSVSALAAGLLLAVGASITQAEPAAKWRIQFDDYTSNDGTITFHVAPDGGTAVDVETKIKKGTGASTVARSVKDSLKASLGKGYDVETDDGQDVVIRAVSKTPKFDLTLTGSTVAGLSVRFKKE
jgi:hypothetical protein